MEEDFTRRDSGHASAWRIAVALIVGVTVVRLIYQRWLSPWELVGDEAYYWVQGQHLDWCYNEKGALFPWLIRLCSAVFGNTQFAVRLTVLLGSSVAAWALWRLTMAVDRTCRAATAALIAVGLFFLVPAMQANAQIATQDGLLIPWTLAMTAIGLRLVRRWSTEANTWSEWIGWWALLGVGMHLRFSAPLLLTAPVCFAFLRRRDLRFGRLMIAQQLVGIAIFLLLLSPILLWNAYHGWPTFEHAAGHLGVGGDQAGRVSKGNPLVWLSETLGGIIGAYGPAIGLVLWASYRSFKSRKTLTQNAWTDELWILCATWPSVLFFVLLSFTKPVIASWPLPSIVPALVLAGIYIERDALFAIRTQHWFRPVWTSTVGYGAVGGLLLMFPGVLGYLPFAGARLNDKVISRIRGHITLADQVQAIRVAQGHINSTGLAATYYDTASLLWFYLPDHPAIHVVSQRPSTYDKWADTRLDSPQLAGQSMLLIGKPTTDWDHQLRFAQIDPTADAAIQLGKQFGGVTPAPIAMVGATFKEKQ